jgi:F-type H+-transporting ATPase subunit alpha
MVTELMKQPQYHPLSVAEQAVTLFGANRGYFDDVPVDKALSFEAALRQFVKSKYAELFNRIETSKDLPEADEKALASAIEDFKKTGSF